MDMSNIVVLKCDVCNKLKQNPKEIWFRMTVTLDKDGKYLHQFFLGYESECSGNIDICSRLCLKEMINKVMGDAVVGGSLDKAGVRENSNE